MINTKPKPKQIYYRAKHKKEDVLKYWEKANANAELLARWICLYDAINIVYDKAEERGIVLDDVDLSPIKIKEYMEATVDNYHRQLLRDMHGIDIFYSERDENDR